LNDKWVYLITAVSAVSSVLNPDLVGFSIALLIKKSNG
jgi:hypothetical protein